jgi:hypothetical protein
VVALVTAVVLGLGLMPSTEEEGGWSPPPCSGGGGGAPSPGRWGCATRGMALAAAPSSPPYTSLPPSLSLSLLFTPLLLETAPQSFRYDVFGGEGGCINGIFYGSDGA